jgi:hypothetical protein
MKELNCASPPSWLPSRPAGVTEQQNRAVHAMPGCRTAATPTPIRWVKPSNRGTRFILTGGATTADGTRSREGINCMPGARQQFWQVHPACAPSVITIGRP